MSSPDASAPTDPVRARQRKMLYLAISLLLLCALALVALPLHRVPLYARIYLAAFDAIIAGVLWVLGRQQLARK